MIELRGPIRATVASRRDPEGRGRVTLFAPGIWEGDDRTQVSAWAEPLNGSAGVDRGTFTVPEEDADVLVWSVHDPETGGGHPDELYYIPGGWSGDDVPDEVRGDDDVVDPDIHAMLVTRDYIVLADERQGTPSLSVRHRPSGDGLHHDGKTLTSTVSATARVSATSAGRADVSAPTVLISGRLVLPGGAIR